MANHTATQKSVRKDAKRTIVNRDRKSRIKTFIKKLETLIGEGKKDEAKAFFPHVESEVMKGASKGTLKRNTASRKVSRLSAKLKAAS
jgi:small subunit ribosomal protein S20